MRQFDAVCFVPQRYFIDLGDDVVLTDANKGNTLCGKTLAGMSLLAVSRMSEYVTCKNCLSEEKYPIHILDTVEL